MQRISMAERPGWRDKAEELGFHFHTMHGEPYWDETSAYAFGLDEIESRIEDPATELHAMCREAVARIVGSEELMDRMAIPPGHRDLVAESWQAGEPELYGRFDLICSGDPGEPAKLLEYNADTPTSLYESAAFQWGWFEDMLNAGELPSGADQFNGIHEALVERLAQIFAPDTDLHFASLPDAPEDYATVEYLAWCAREAGLGAHYVPMDQIGISGEGQFTDAESRVIGALFKLYPWEDMLRDDFAGYIRNSGCRILEPAWKALVSNKGILPVLWEMFPRHPNLLPARFGDSADAAEFPGGHVIKPVFSREGASITIVDAEGGRESAANRAYDALPMIVQAYQPLPEFDGFRPVVGAWIVGERCVGMGIREDRSRITQDLSRFKPHFFV